MGGGKGYMLRGGIDLVESKDSAGKVDYCWRGAGLPPTKIQEMAIRTRKPTAIPRVLAAPTFPNSALPTNPPRKREAAASTLWSRDTTFSRSLKSRGSDISSTQTVVSTTISDEGYCYIQGSRILCTHWSFRIVCLVASPECLELPN